MCDVLVHWLLRIRYGANDNGGHTCVSIIMIMSVLALAKTPRKYLNRIEDFIPVHILRYWIFEWIEG